MRRKIESKKNGGLVMVLVLVLVLLIVMALGSFMGILATNNQDLQRTRESTKAFYVAEAGLEMRRMRLYNDFSSYFNANGRTTATFSWFDALVGSTVNGLLSASNTYSVTVSSVTEIQDGGRDVTLTSIGTSGEVTRRMRSVIRYGLAPSRVFDYAYFINNFGWMYGGGITVNGDVRSNGNFGFQGNPVVNGDIYASVNQELGAAGTISGNSRNDSISWYRSHAGNSARPTNPPADGGSEYPNGYDGASDRYPYEEIIEMPYLGDLSIYRSLAETRNGTISQGGTTLVDNVHEGNIALIGTEDNPIEVTGPVVVTGDVVIKGVVTGQGTIYSGRNTHIVGDVTLENPPSWPKPDSDPDSTDATNSTRDFLGLATKGNVIIGDYTQTSWLSTVRGYIRPPFTQGYTVDATDTVNGYDSDNNPSNGYWFNGDYSAYDGGTKVDGSQRRFYESSFADSYIHSVGVPASSIRRVDAVTYTNHAFAGNVGAFSMNGTIVSRDEAIIYSGSITLNYDLRAKTMGYDFYLPRSLALPQSQSWGEY
jgi:Tfp pilus assembly protein PilV